MEKNPIIDHVGPITVPGFIGDLIVKVLQKKPDLSDHWVKYKGVIRPHSGGKGGSDIRIFDEWVTNQRGLKVTDYAFLDQHPDLVQFEGWFDEKKRIAEINDIRESDNSSIKLT